jgi:DNA (cytosine-5)-methyltransferase 1
MQLSILEQFTNKPIKKERVRVFEAFAGYGSQSLALDWLNIDYELVGYAEIDPYAIKAHIALHGDVKNYGDVTKLSVADLPDMDLFTYSFPCQDISVAGKQNGLAKDSGTRSSLLWECERIIEGKRPKYLMMENVKNLVGVENYPHFMAFVHLLEGFGYNNYWQVINAKECGIPQNRERIFCVSIRQDVDDGSFYFEKPFDNGLRLKDLLESEVDEKYYLNDEYLERFLKSNPISNTDIKIIGTTVGNGEGTNCRHWVHDVSGIVGALSATDYKQPKQIAIREATKQGYAIANQGDSINLEHPDSKTRRGRVGKGVAQTLTTSCNQAVVNNKYRIRKLTVTEVFRLMGLNDDQIIKIQSADISNSQQYKMAGNSIVVQQMAFLKNLPGIKFKHD